MLRDRQKSVDPSLYASLPPLKGEEPEEVEEKSPEDLLEEIIEDALKRETTGGMLVLPQLGMRPAEWQSVPLPPEPEPVDPRLFSSSGEQLLAQVENPDNGDWLINISRSEHSLDRWTWTAVNLANQSASTRFQSTYLEETEDNARSQAIDYIMKQIERDRILRESVRYEYFKVVDDAT